MPHPSKHSPIDLLIIPADSSTILSAHLAIDKKAGEIVAKAEQPTRLLAKV
jgi:hypothetical protein